MSEPQPSADTTAKDATKIRRMRVIVAITVAGTLLTAALIIGSYSIITHWPDYVDSQTLNGAEPGLLNKILSVVPQEPLRPMKLQIDELEGALMHVHSMAAGGNAEAKRALDEARRSGDMSKIQALLIREADRLHAQTDFSEFTVLNGEIAAVAYYRGDLDQALLRVQFVIDHRPADLYALHLCGVIHNVRGELMDSQRCFEQMLKWSTNNELWQSFALQCLGVFHRERGELDRAEEMFQKSLAIEEKLDRQQDMAEQYGNLGVIYRERGELDRAEEMHQKALALNEGIRHLNDMASDYGNLGMIYLARGEWDRAEEMVRKALDIDEPLGRQQGMADQYGNLGRIYLARGELDRAEEMHRKSLAIEEKLDQQLGMARKFLDLGFVAQARGELERVRELWTKARDLYAKLEIPTKVKLVQEWLDELPQGGGTK